MSFIKKLVSLSLVAVFSFNAFAVDTSNWSWGEVLSKEEYAVAPETTYSKISVSSPIGPQSINAIEFNPKNENLTLRAGLSNGEIYGNQTVAGMANDFNKKGEGQVIAAINADYFTFGVGVPFGIFMDGGTVLSTPPQYTASFGLKSDGTPFCQSHGTIMNKILIVDGQKTELTAINGSHGSSGNSIVLYNKLFDNSTHAPKDSVEVVLSLVSGEFRHGETLSLIVEEIIPEGGNTKIPADKLVLSARGTYKDLLLNLTEEQEVSVLIQFNDFWSDVSFAISGNYLLLKDGEIQDVTNNERTARTMIGVKPDGNVIFYTVDGKLSGHSVGVTYKQAARIMQELGCVDAINLDGGGSTTFAMRYLGTNTVKMINRSASSPRAVANALLLVNTATPTSPTKVLFSSYNKRVLVGYSQKFSLLGGMDGNYLSYELTSPINWSTNEEIGTILEDGTFTPYAPGVAVITAEVDGVYGDVYCTVIDSVDSIVAKDAITVKSEETVDIAVSLLSEGVSVPYNKDQLTWEVEGEIGEFVAPGKFKATKLKNEGKIFVSYGETVKEIAVDIDGPTPEDLEPFKDMGGHIWAKDGLYRLFDAGIVKGVSETEFAPSREIKRADFILMLIRLMGIEIDTTADDQFDDVHEGSYYYYELATAKRLGIAQGTSATTFSPERPITRQEMFTLTWRTLEISTAKDLSILDVFADGEDIAEYAKPAIATLASLDMIAGDNYNKVNPGKNTTRAEAVVFLDRVYSYIGGDTADEQSDIEITE